MTHHHLQPTWPSLPLLSAALVLAACALPADDGGGFRPALAVLPMHNLSGYGGALLGRRAADQVALDFGSSGAWRVLDRAQSDRACQQREMTPPYAVGYMQELAHALGADLVCSGAVQSVEVDGRAGVVRLTMYVEVVDQVSGQMVVASRPAVVVRRSAGAPEPTDALVSRALAQAAAEAAELAAAGPRVQGEVTSPGSDGVVELAFVTQAGVKPGQRLLLYRPFAEGDVKVPGRLLAALMVIRADGSTVRAEVLGRSGDIHTGDLAVAVGPASASANRPGDGRR